MNIYKKRAQAGRCTGRSYKKESNRSERVFSKKEIRKTSFISSESEKVSIKFEIKNDEETLTFLNESPEYVLKASIRNSKRKISKSIKTLKGKILHFEKKLNLLKNNVYGFPFLQTYYKEEIVRLCLKLKQQKQKSLKG